jgi:hypothetical protein
MIKALTNCPPNVPPAIASPPSPIRLLLSRVVALLVFAVSPAIPARWSGRRWVGPVVVTIVGAVGGFALLWVWLWLVLSTRYFGAAPANASTWLSLATLIQLTFFPLILLIFGVRQSELMSFFLPGFRLASLVLEIIVLNLVMLLPGVIITEILFLKYFESSGLRWIGILLVPILILSLLSSKIIVWRYRNKGPALWFLLFILTSPFLGLMGLVYPKNQLLVGLLIALQCIHLSVAGRMYHLSLTVPFHAGLVRAAIQFQEVSKSGFMFPNRGTEMILMRRFAKSPFVLAFTADVFGLMRTLAVVILHTALIGLSLLTMGGHSSKELVEDMVLNVGPFIGIVNFLLASVYPRDMWTTVSPPRRSRRSALVGALAAPCAAFSFSLLVWVLVASVSAEVANSGRVAILSLFAVFLWFLVSSPREVDILRAKEEISFGSKLFSAILFMLILIEPAALLAVSSLRMIYILNAIRRGDLAH